MEEKFIKDRLEGIVDKKDQGVVGLMEKVKKESLEKVKALLVSIGKVDGGTDALTERVCSFFLKEKI